MLSPIAYLPSFHLVRDSTMDFFSTPEAADLFFGLTRPSPLCFKSDDERISCLSPAPGAASDAQPTPAALAGECGRADSALPVLQHPSQPPASPDVLSTRLAPSLVRLPDEILLLIAGHLDVDDLLCTSRTCHSLRRISLDPVLHQERLRHTRHILPPLLSPLHRPSLGDLVSRSIFLTNNTVVSRRLARSLVSIRLARRLAARPSPETLMQRCVLPRECVPVHRKADSQKWIEEMDCFKMERSSFGAGVICQEVQ